MNDNTNFISEQELDRLDEFLSSRIDEDEYTPEKDEGIFCLSQLDGFLTAVASGPVMIPPSQWLPAIWGDFEPEWESEEEFQSILLLMTSIMNSNIETLMNRPERFEPFFNEHFSDGKTFTIVDEWCEGYMRGVSLAQDLWMEAGFEMEVLLLPIISFTEEGEWRGHDFTDDVKVKNLQNAVCNNAREIHAYWLALRENLKPAVSTVQRQTPRIGRNEPCPCGSGKKYKKCCLH